MDFKSYREIILSYANSHGKGLPLTAEEYCNAMALYIQEVLPEYQNETLAYIKDQIENGGLVDSYIASVVNANTADIIVSWADDNFNSYVRAFFEDENDWFTAYLTTKADSGDLDGMFGYGIVSSGAIRGSETVVVDSSEDGFGVEVHLDSEVVSKIERSVKTPLSNPSEPALPVLGVNGATEWEPVSSFVGGGGTQLYKHIVSLGIITLTIISNRETAYTDVNQLSPLNWINCVYLGGNVFSIARTSQDNVTIYFYNANSNSISSMKTGITIYTDEVTPY